MIATKENLLTVLEFEKQFLNPEDSNRLVELIDGKLYEKMPTEEHGVIASNIVFLLKLFVKQFGYGRVGVEVRHRIPSDNHNSRLPDVSFSTTEREIVRQGSVPEMPDLAVEIKSPSDTIRDLRQTADYYLAHGSKSVWLVFPHQRIVEIYRHDADIQILNDNDKIVDEELFPDYELAVSDIFE